MTQWISLHGVPVEATFAEAFDMKATRIIITAEDHQWAADAAAAMTGFGTSVIACGIEIAVERELCCKETPDGRPGIAILAFAVSGSELLTQIPRRAAQCVLTCPTTALFAGLPDEGVGEDPPKADKRIPLGQSLRYFGDGQQISKVTGGRRFWRVPVMDGEFVCEHDVGRIGGIGGGNFLLLGESIRDVTLACRAAVKAMRPLPGIITPFPGGATRSGSKVGSKYKALFASTNEAYCPTLQTFSASSLSKFSQSYQPSHASDKADAPARVGQVKPDGIQPSHGSDEADAPAGPVRAVLEVVIDGISAEAIAESMKIGISAACQVGGGAGLLGVTAGNYGGKLGRHHFHLAEILK